MAIRRSSSRQEIRELQTLLQNAGFDVGPIDGLWGPLTQAAVDAAKQARADAGGNLGTLGTGAGNNLLEQLRTGAFSEGAWVSEADTSGEDSTETEDVTKDTTPAPGAEGGASDDFPGVMPGGELVRVEREGQDDLWIMRYEYPPGSGQYVAWEFDNLEQVGQVFGEDWAARVGVTVIDETSFEQSTSLLDGVAEITGLDTAFVEFMDDATREAALSLGLTDPTILGAMANDPEIQAIIAEATLGGWSNDEARIRGELRGTTFWTEVLYPGIETFYDMGSTTPEEDWLRYSRQMEGALRSLGFDVTTEEFRQEIGAYLEAGVDAELAAAMVPTFQRAQTSEQFAEILDKWLRQETGQELDFDAWFDVLAGEAPADINLVVEAATLQYAAEQASFQIADETITRLAEQTQMSEREAAAAFQSVQDQLLALGDEGLARYGLTRDDLLSDAAGIESLSGRSNSEIRQLASKTATELSLADDRKLNLYVGYNPRTGTPNRPGALATAQEGG